MQHAIVNRCEDCVAKADGRRWNKTIQAPNTKHGRLKSRRILSEAGLHEGLHCVGRFAETQSYHRRCPTNEVVFVNGLCICVQGICVQGKCVQGKKYEKNYGESSDDFEQSD